MVEDLKANTVADQSQLKKILLASVLVMVAVLIGTLIYRSLVPLASSPQPLQGKAIISQNDLEKQTGLRITLVAVTAAGGMVDFRFKVIDVEKARKTLQEGKLLPYLIVAGSNINLKPAPETLQDLKLENGLVYYILYSNTGNLVKPGTPVSVIIGDWQTEPINAK